MTFYVCDVYGKTPCVFSERTMRPLWKRSGGDIARCIRHGALITTETRQPDVEAARKWARQVEHDEARP
jgi:hypothetical protein